MRRDLDHLREQAERAWRWAAAIPDPTVRQRLEVVARDYEEMIRNAERRPRSDTLRNGSDD